MEYCRYAWHFMQWVPAFLKVYASQLLSTMESKAEIFTQHLSFFLSKQSTWFKTLINTLLLNNKKNTLPGSNPVFYLVGLLSLISFFELLCSEAFQKYLDKSLAQDNDAATRKGRQAASAPGHQHCSKPLARLEQGAQVAEDDFTNDVLNTYFWVLENPMVTIPRVDTLY